HSHTTCHLRSPSSSPFLITPPPPRSTLFPYTTLFRSEAFLRGDLGDDTLHPAHDALHRFGFLLGKIFLQAHIGALEQDLSEKERSEEHTSEVQSLTNPVCRLVLEKKKSIISLSHTRIS